MRTDPSRRVWAGQIGMTAGALALACSAGSPAGSGPARVIVEDDGEQPSPMVPPVMMPPPTPDTGGGAVFDPDDQGTTGADPAAAVRLRGLKEKQVTCEGDGRTTISGTVYIPAGTLPVYNALVYVPDSNLQPLTPGASCGCQISGSPIATALTDSAGHFVLENAPVGEDIPLVVQVGDWRREFNIGTVSACTDTPVPDQTLRLPAMRSQGDMPKIAVGTAFFDSLECLVRKLGIDKSEFTHIAGDGRVQFFAADERGTNRFADDWNEGREFQSAEYLWSTVELLQPYDVVLLSCDGQDDYLENKSPEARQAVHDYLNLGGRVFGSHFQEAWFEHGPEQLPEIATFTDDDLGDISAQVVTSFPKGQALAEWLVNVGASEVLGEIPIRSAQYTIVEENPALAQRWIATADPDSVQYISANTPLGAPEAEQCGRLVLSDIHVSPGGTGDDVSRAQLEFPQGCVTEGFSPQEAVLAFMLFDITACVVPDDQAPVAPPPIY